MKRMMLNLRRTCTIPRMLQRPASPPCQHTSCGRSRTMTLPGGTSCRTSGTWGRGSLRPSRQQVDCCDLMPHLPSSAWHAVFHVYLIVESEWRRWACAGTCSYARGWGFTTIICEQGLYIPWLMDQALRAGVSLQCRTIHDLQVSRTCPSSTLSKCMDHEVPIPCIDVRRQSVHNDVPIMHGRAGAARLLGGRQLHRPGRRTPVRRHGDVPGQGPRHPREGALDQVRPALIAWLLAPLLPSHLQNVLISLCCSAGPTTL